MSKRFYIALPEDKIDLVQFGFYALLTCALYIWFSIQVQVNITADTLWLADAAGRLLRGESMSQAFYDPNPPMSMILYIPPVLMADTGLISLHNALFFYVLLFLVGASIATYKILRVIPGNDITTAMVGTVALIVSATIASAASYTERDQIIGICLVPFILTQLAMTKGWPVPVPLKHFTLLVGTMLILVKPHHGLLPTLLIAHRAITQKRLSVCKDADFLYLAAGGIGYTVILLFCFPDFLQIILPDVLALYMPSNSIKFVLFSVLYYTLLCVIIILLANIAGRISWLPYLFLGMAIISLIPFIVQMRGYHYHLMPTIIFLWCGAAFFAKDFLQRYMSPHLALVFVTSAMITISFSLSQSRLSLPTVTQYKTLPMAELLFDCDSPCPFFVINDHIEITHQTALYTGKMWASRFPSLWFVPRIYQLKETNPLESERLQKKYAAMIVNDIERYKPRYILAGNIPLSKDITFNFIEFSAVAPSFSKVWSTYKAVGEITINQELYFPPYKEFKNHKLTYMLYKRNPDPYLP